MNGVWALDVSLDFRSAILSREVLDALTGDTAIFTTSEGAALLRTLRSGCAWKARADAPGPAQKDFTGK